MHVGLFEQIATNSLPDSAFKQHVVGYNHRTAAVDLQHRVDVLQKVQLLVPGRHPEARAFAGGIVVLQFGIFVDDGDAAFLSERWIGQHQADSFGRIRRQRIDTRTNRACVGVDCNAVKVQINDAQASRIGNQFAAADEFGSQVLLLVFAQLFAVFVDDKLLSCQQKSAVA